MRYRMAISALSPTTNRYARGSSGLRAIATFLPIRLASIRPFRSADRRSLEHDRVLDLGAFDTTTSSPIAV